MHDEGKTNRIMCRLSFGTVPSECYDFEYRHWSIIGGLHYLWSVSRDSYSSKDTTNKCKALWALVNLVYALMLSWSTVVLHI